jgi:hypothetical protein
MDYNLEIGNTIKTFAFKIKQSTPHFDNVAFGMCHKNIVANKFYRFSDSHLIDHGCYLINSNGRSFSHI